jgi:exodeoxyribonuclease VII large subunit
VLFRSPAGEGAYYQEFLRLKARFEEEGLFDPQRKRPIPQFPHRIGIATSPSGAALQDMLNVLTRRYPLAEVCVAPTAVQGADAPAGIVSAIRALNHVVKPDVILVARGGGSIEDLWAFNDEQVVRTIAASQAPVITGVGHETDFTLADFAADLRAPTPTAAAELCTPNRDDLLADLRGLAGSLAYIMNDLLAGSRQDLVQTQGLLRRYSPLSKILSERQRVDETQRAGLVALRHRLAIEDARINGLQQRLVSLSPQAVLQRGYAIVTHLPGGELVRGVAQTAPGDRIHVRLADGGFDAQVNPYHDRT